MDILAGILLFQCSRALNLPTVFRQGVGYGCRIIHHRQPRHRLRIGATVANRHSKLNRMSTRKTLILITCSVVIAFGCGRKFKVPPALASPLIVCQAVPPNMPEDLRRLYSQICSATNTEQRSEALQGFSHLRAASYSCCPPMFHPSPSEMVAFLPLLSELMTTGDYFEREGRRIYVCEEAAGTMSGAGGTAIPFVIKALQSKNPLEVHAGLECAQDIVEFLEWRVETNDLPAVCSNLLPYVTICITNGGLECTVSNQRAG